MKEITSTTNNLIKETAKLALKKYRNERKLFLIEGQKAVKEAYQLGVKFENIFILKEKFIKFAEIFTENENVTLVNEAVMKKIATTETEPDIIVTAKQVNFKLSEIKEKNKLILLENIKDSGNLGTIIRTCTAFGADAVILAGETADIYNPKTIRAAVGNLFKIPIISVKSVLEAKKIFDKHLFYGTVVSGEAESIVGLKLSEKAVIMFGSEAGGLSEEAFNAADKKITIPISKNVESLNLSTAVTICIWELFRK